MALLKKELEISRLQQKIAQDVEEKVKTQHRKYILYEQLKVSLPFWPPIYISDEILINLPKFLLANLNWPRKNVASYLNLEWWNFPQVIKKELGIEKDDKDAIGDKYRALIKDKTIPESVSVVIEEELNKLNFLESNSSEFK